MSWTYLIVVDNLCSTVVNDMEQLLVLISCSSVQLSNLPLLELFRIQRVALRVVKYAKVSSQLKTLRKRLEPP